MLGSVGLHALEGRTKWTPLSGASDLMGALQPRFLGQESKGGVEGEEEFTLGLGPSQGWAGQGPRKEVQAEYGEMGSSGRWGHLGREGEQKGGREGSGMGDESVQE